MCSPTFAVAGGEKPHVTIRPLKREADELMAIFVTIVKNKKR